MINNYFKCANGKVFGFNDRIPESIDDAYNDACLYQGVISSKPLAIFRPTPSAGPWDTCTIIGHRSRTRVLSDRRRAKNSDTIERLHNELDAIHLRFVEVGRSVPLQVVEAA